MAKEVIWSYEAATDLKDLAEYISRDSMYYAAAFVQEIIDESRTLNSFPKLGRIVPELKNSTIRELFVREYRLIYKLEKTSIIVLGIVHGRRDLQELWKKQKRG